MSVLRWNWDRHRVNLVLNGRWLRLKLSSFASIPFYISLYVLIRLFKATRPNSVKHDMLQCF